MPCRTAALGGHVQAWPDGHVARIGYHSCRHRSCPQCADLQTARWLALQRARLLACDQYHVIFTLPHDLLPLWLANMPVMTTLLLQAVRHTLVTLLADPQYLGAQPGILAALHTWSQPLVRHPHVHCLVTGGGLTADGAWQAVRTGLLLSVRVIMAVLRGKLLAAVRQSPGRAPCALGPPPVEAPAVLDWQTVCAQRGAEAPRGLDLPGVRLWMRPIAVVPGRMAEGSRHVNSRARGRENLVRPPPCTVRPIRG